MRNKMPIHAEKMRGQAFNIFNKDDNNNEKYSTLVRIKIIISHKPMERGYIGVFIILVTLMNFDWLVY